MLDVVQQSFTDGSRAPTSEVLRIAAMSIFLTAAKDIFRYFSGNTDNIISVSILSNHGLSFLNE